MTFPLARIVSRPVAKAIVPPRAAGVPNSPSSNLYNRKNVKKIKML